MLNRPSCFLWISIRIEGEHRFRFSLPIPLFPFFMIADIMEDASLIWRIFHRRSTKLPSISQQSGFSMETLKNPTPEMLQAAALLLQKMLVEVAFHFGNENLVDIDVQSEKEHVQVRCSFR